MFVFFFFFFFKQKTAYDVPKREWSSDVCSSDLLDCRQQEEAEGLDLFGLSRYLERRGEAAKAESACVAARNRGLPLPFDGQAQRGLARMAKRRGEHAA